ncbi:MAG: hypothetical protein ABIH26_13105, partial [Candidatus Eisenbacteria bacterium]
MAQSWCRRGIIFASSIVLVLSSARGEAPPHPPLDPYTADEKERFISPRLLRGRDLRLADLPLHEADGHAASPAGCSPPDSSLGGDDLWWNGFAVPGAYAPFGHGGPGGLRTICAHDGALLVAGSFAYFDGVEANGVARWDGTAWRSAEIRGGAFQASCFLARGEDLLAGGSCTDSSSALYLWDGLSWEPVAGGRLTEPGCSINGLALLGDDLIVIGQGPYREGQRGRFVLLEREGSWIDITPDTLYGSYPFLTSVLGTEGEVWVGGRFHLRDEDSTGNIMKWDGASWEIAGGGTNERVWSLAAYDGKVVAGGSFSRAGNADAACIASWDGSGWVPFGEGIRGLGATWVSTLYAANGRLYVGGDFDTAGTIAAQCLAVWNGTEWEDLGSSDRYDLGYPRIAGFAEHDGNLVIAGNFSPGDLRGQGNVLLWNESRWSRVTGRGVDLIGPATAMLPTETALIVAGEFALPGTWGTSRGVARWDGSGWEMLGEGFNGAVAGLGMFRGRIVAGGSFTAVDSQAVGHVAAWNGDSWEGLGEGLDDDVNVLTVYDDRLIAGGWFRYSGGDVARRVAQWDGTAWTEVGFGINGAVFDLAVYGGDLIACGFFNYAGLDWIQCIARWDGEDWRPVGSDVTYRYDCPAVTDLTVWNGRLVAAGDFEAVSGETAGELAIWDGVAWHPVMPSCVSSATELGTFGGRLVVGGFFRFGDLVWDPGYVF